MAKDEIANMKFYSDKLKQVRKKLKISSEELALKMGIHRTTLSSWERNKVTPSEVKVRSIAKSLDVSVEEISDLTPDKSRSPIDISHASSTLSNLINKEKKSKNSRISALISELTKLDKEFNNASLIIEALISSISAIYYIKNCDSKYVIANKSFLQNLSLNEKCVVLDKTDFEFFSKDEALRNDEEDRLVISSGKEILDREDYIPGSRRKKWGIISKTLILDAQGNIEGLIGMFVDITERRKGEIFRKIIEKCMIHQDIQFWIGKGLGKNNKNEFNIKNMLYRMESKSTKYLLKGREHFSINDNRNFLVSLIIEKPKFPDFSKSNEDCPVSVLEYKLRDPFDSNILYDIRELIGHDRKRELYFGFAFELLYPKKLEAQKELFIKSMKKHNIPADIIRQITDEVSAEQKTLIVFPS